MQLRSLDGCRLSIGRYPAFEYNARGGGGKGRLASTKQENILHINFSSETFVIPPLTWRTTKFLYLPLPPGLKIEMSMDKLEGTINRISGEVVLDFESRFIFSIGSIFIFPNLLVKTSLETGKIKGYLNEVEGFVRQKNGKTKLAGVSMIPKTGNNFLDTLLGLPNEAVAILHCEIQE